MSHFDERHDSPAVRISTLAFVEALLGEIMPPMTLAARGCGYALAVHGSRCRDVDVLAVPWTEQADDPDRLVERLLGVLAGKVGRAVQLKGWSDKPHGRRALTIILPGMCPEIDLSVMPLASVDTHPKGGDVKQAPFMGGAVPNGETPDA